jgi:hypothetical protein
MVIRSLRFFVWMLVSTWQLALATPQVTVEVEPSKGTRMDRFVMMVRIEGGRGSLPPTVEPNDDFAVHYIGPQTSIAIVNGAVSSHVTHAYQLLPRRSGALRSPAVIFEGHPVGDQQTIQVTDGPEPESPSDAAPVDSEEIFLKQSATPQSVYVGQQVVSTVTLYTSSPLNEVQLADLTYTDFWRETFGSERRARRQIKGRDYLSLQFRSALFPLNEGSFELPEQSLKATLIRRNRGWPFPDFDNLNDPFAGFFGGGSSDPIEVRSERVPIEVLPLPAPPAGLSLTSPAIVGPTSLKVNYSVDRLTVGSGKTVEIVVSSEGNLNSLKSLPLTSTSDVQVYEETPRLDRDVRGAKMILRKIFRYSLVPTRSGLVQLPPISLSYFDPDLKEYQTATTSPIAFPVEVDPNAPPPPTPQPEAEPAGPSKTIAPYEEKGALQRLGDRIPLSVALLALAIVAGIGTLGWYGARLRSGRRVTKLDLRGIDSADSIRALNGTFRRIIADRYRLPTPNLSTDEIREALRARGVPAEVIFEIGILLDEFDLSLYSGTEYGDLEEMRTKLRVLIDRESS